MSDLNPAQQKPILLITGAAGNLGGSLCEFFKDNYTVIGFDIKPCRHAHEYIECNLTSADSVNLAAHKLSTKYGTHIAGVIHLAAYFDFTGEENKLYDDVNIEGTRRLLKALQDFKVERFIYSSTMLVHEPTVPGNKINEETAIDPSWAYPRSKAQAEDIIKQEAGDMPYLILRLAGLYNDETAVPTLSYQIARIFERDFKSHLYSGDVMAGQAFLHEDDMRNALSLALEKRDSLPKQCEILIGEPEVMGYQELQNRIGNLVFGEKEWGTISLPEPIAKAGAWAECKAEPLIPDAIDQGEKPFIKPFMIDLASDHYDIDGDKAQKLLGFTPQHHIYKGLEKLVASLQANPLRWYKNNHITPPDWVSGAAEKGENASDLRTQHEQVYRDQHRQFLWAHFMNMGLALWLITAPFILSYESQAMIYSDMISGGLLFIFGLLSLSWRMPLARIGAGAVGLWVLGAPLIFWAPTAAAYMNGTIIGMLVMGFAVCSRPMPGVAALAYETGPDVPPGWGFNPSGWFQRMPIIILAFIGFFISRYLCAYQLGHIEGIWEPFFSGDIPKDAKNGTEEIITSSVSEAWPVPDAGLGAMTYALEIVTGLMGSTKRWRTMPWLVMLFGIMIVPLGAISIFFIIIQPIMLGTWCTLCLIAAAAMLIQIPYSLDELVATSEFLYRRKKAGHSLLRVFIFGDTDEGRKKEFDDFEQAPTAIIKDMLGGGVTLPWNLMLCIPIGIWLMFSRVSVGASEAMANADHLVGALALTFVITALAESGRAARFALIPLGLALFVTPFVYAESTLPMISSMICGGLFIGLSFPKGKISNHYGAWDKAIV